MDVYKHNAFERLEIVETGRRRRWSDDEKLRIVTESQSAPSPTPGAAARDLSLAVGNVAPQIPG